MNTVQRFLLQWLVPDWRSAWRLASVWCFLATLIVVGFWLLLSVSADRPYPVTQSDLVLLGALQALGIIVRVVQQRRLVMDVLGQIAADITETDGDSPPPR